MERLQKILAQAGIASRRRAEEMILAGRVRVNGQVVNTLGVQVDPASDKILVDNYPVALESKAYFILNKPRGYISDRDDTGGFKTALDMIPGNLRLFAAGRLDMNSEGLLFLTNDGELANRLTHPRYEHEKEYLVLVFGTPDDKMLERLTRGIPYEGEWLRADSAERAGKQQLFGEAGRDEMWLRIVLHEGKKRQIRHMCAALGYPVKRLIRVRIGPLLLGKLKPGEWRKLTPDEIAQLRGQTQPRSGGRPKPQAPRREYAPENRTAQNKTSAPKNREPYKRNDSFDVTKPPRRPASNKTSAPANKKTYRRDDSFDATKPPRRPASNKTSAPTNKKPYRRKDAFDATKPPRRPARPVARNSKPNPRSRTPKRP